MGKIIPNDRLVNIIKCPVCGVGMELAEEKSLLCKGARRHCYDLSSRGYVNMMPPGHTDSGDSKAAVRARTDFLDLGYYRPAAEALADAISDHLKEGSIVVDAGCGEGYYTSMIAERGFLTAGVDISRPAVDSTAKRTFASGVKNGFFAVGSVFSLPFLDGSVDGVANVFAPCSEEEFCRVLKSGGILAVVYAGPEHLMGLKRVIYDAAKENDRRRDLPENMTLLEERRVSFDITVKGEKALQDLFAMTPYYWRTSPSDSLKLKSMDSLTTAVDMTVAIYQKA